MYLQGGDACIVVYRNAYPVDEPGLASFGVDWIISAFVFFIVLSLPDRFVRFEY